jgi:GPH family glycoside/pentoside/hexuronide:cation symporter
MATDCIEQEAEQRDSSALHVAGGREDRLTFREKAGYALGDAAFVLFWHTWSQFLLIFYTDVAGLNAVAVGLMLGVTRLVDAIVDPVMGVIADQTKSRHGKFRPWLLWGVIPYMILGVLLFTVPGFSQNGRLIYAYVTFIGVSIVYTMLNIPYSALMGVMTVHSHERTILASYRFYGAYIGVFIVNLTLLKLVSYFGGGDQAIGYQRTMLVYALTAGLLILLVFFATKERVKPPRGQAANVKADLAQVVQNKPLIAVILVGILTLVWMTLRNGASLYYLKYHFGADDETISALLTVGTISVLISVAGTGLAERRLGGKKLAFVILTLATGLLTCGYYFVDRDDLALLYAITIVSQVTAAPLMPLFWSMIADTADYSEWKFGRRTTGLIFSAGTFSQKTGGALGGALAGTCLGWVGYVANAQQSPEAIEGLKAMMSFLPSLIGLAAAAAVAFYGITPALAKQIEQDLAARHASSA